MPYMSATIQFLVSSPRSSSGSFAVSSPAELESSTDDSRSSWLLFCARTASWAYHSAIAGVTLPPVSALSYYAEQTPQVNCLHTSARILQDCRLSLIHIPLPLYPHFVHALLSLILPEASAKPDDANDYSSNPDSCVATDFVNISVTPVECSVVCSQLATERFFVPVINSLDPSVREDVAISPDEFVAIQVDGEGLDAGQRVLDLTSPLAQAKVPIFFITTYFSDYILVPENSRKSVTKALQHRGFIFEKYSDSFVTTPTHRRQSESMPSSPTIGDLESSTFTALRKQNVIPEVDQIIKLVLCAGRRSARGGCRGDDARILKLGLIRCLVAQPKFMSITLTDTEPASLLLEKDMLSMFDSDSDILLGSKDDVLIPITLDLRGLPAESTGIVCSVAGRLVGGTKSGFSDGHGAVEMSYLSTARAGTVMVAENDIERAMAALSV